jgi:membrane associated rhomboid family serine protease
VFPLYDDNPTFRVPITTIGLIVVMLVVWVFVQGGGFDPRAVAASVCNYGLVPAELTHLRPVGFAVPISEDMACIIDDSAVNWATPVFSQFLHGGWAHIFGNALFLWVFGNNVEDIMGRGRFLFFYLLCGTIAAAAHTIVEPTSPIPTVGASGAVSGVLGAYILLYPRVRVRVFFPPIFLFFVPAWLMLGWWFLKEFLTGLPQLFDPTPAISGGVAVWAHIGGFIAGLVFSRAFEDRSLIAEHKRFLHLRGYP